MANWLECRRSDGGRRDTASTAGGRTRAILALLALLLAAPGVQAEQDFYTLYGANDWYMSIAPMFGVATGDLSGEDPGGGGTVAAGFRWNRWFTTEVGGEWVHRFRYSDGSGPSCAGISGDQSNGFGAWQITGGGRIYATQARVQPYLVGAGGIMQSRDSGGGKSCTSTSFVARGGAGVDVFVTSGLAVSLSGTYVAPITGGRRKYHDYVSVNLGLIWY